MKRLEPLFTYEDVDVGDEFISPSRTVGESDVFQFAGITGDFNELHTQSYLVVDDFSDDCNCCSSYGCHSSLENVDLIPFVCYTYNGYIFEASIQRGGWHRYGL